MRDDFRHRDHPVGPCWCEERIVGEARSPKAIRTMYIGASDPPFGATFKRWWVAGDLNASAFVAAFG